MYAFECSSKAKAVLPDYPPGEEFLHGGMREYFTRCVERFRELVVAADPVHVRVARATKQHAVGGEENASRCALNPGWERTSTDVLTMRLARDELVGSSGQAVGEDGESTHRTDQILAEARVWAGHI
eukprot:CAMPEP_0180060410 /NCGR_PEP_ID=MMETSP0985-20121206/6047_1 /TAXON_ID=483367 /ORGANISM="non described non described, Strain CCMP 2436" /LENGTH=126 /DNA_ID=CAMNT_0021990471 /DNA_START=38 /DNA_END=419 /DNA_ORIENTATION=+